MSLRVVKGHGEISQLMEEILRDLHKNPGLPLPTPEEFSFRRVGEYLCRMIETLERKGFLEVRDGRVYTTRQAEVWINDRNQADLVRQKPREVSTKGSHR